MFSYHMSNDSVIVIVLNIVAVLFFLTGFVKTVKNNKSFNIRNTVMWFTENNSTLNCKS